MHFGIDETENAENSIEYIFFHIFEMAVGIFNKCFDVSSQFMEIYTYVEHWVHVAISLIFGRIPYNIRC